MGFTQGIHGVIGHGTTRPDPARYRRTNWKSCDEALKQRGWLNEDMAWRAPGIGRNGRPPVFSDAAIPFCLMVKVLFGLPLRQTKRSSAHAARENVAMSVTMGDSIKR